MKRKHQTTGHEVKAPRDRLLGLFALCILMLMAGCGLKTEYASNSSVTAVSTCRLVPESEHSQPSITSETKTISASVAAIAFTPDIGALWVAYSGTTEGFTGQISQIELQNWQVINSLVLDSPSPRFTRFNGDGSLIASANTVECPTDMNPRPITQGSCAEPKVWDTATGQLTSVTRYSPATDLQDLAFDRQGHWLLAAQKNLRIFSPLASGGRYSITPAGDKENSLDDVVTGAFNKSGDLVAYGTKERRIGIKAWDGQSLKHAYILNIGIIQSEGGGEEKIDVAPIKLAISPNNKWLAIQFDEGIELLDMTSGFFPQQGKVSLPRTATGVLEFNPSGLLLAVGYSEGMRIYSVPDLKLILDKPGPQASTMAFSPDGCLLAWGDEQGTVHIISTPKP
jgi:WD40 repeat protein